MVQRAYLALGSNVGNREEYLRRAVEALQAVPQITVTGLSSVYETDPVGYVEQEAFLNMVVAIETSYTPTELLHKVLDIEQQLGRVRLIRWGPRVIDLDIILFGDEQVQLPDLQIPHPSLLERAFVMVPLRDLWPQEQSFFAGKSLDDYIDATHDAKGVRLWGQLDLDIASGPSEN